MEITIILLAFVINVQKLQMILFVVTLYVSAQRIRENGPH